MYCNKPPIVWNFAELIPRGDLHNLQLFISKIDDEVENLSETYVRLAPLSGLHLYLALAYV